MKSTRKIPLGVLAACVLLPGMLFAQSAGDAKAFLLDNAHGEWNDKGSFASSQLMQASCTQFVLRKCANNWISYEFSSEEDRVHYCWTESFDPTRVEATAIPFEPGNPPRIGLNCYTGQCVSRDRPGMSTSTELTDAFTLVDSARVKKAFDVFQASCGGPKKPAF
jgi:hypothetical protein